MSIGFAPACVGDLRESRPPSAPTTREAWSLKGNRRPSLWDGWIPALNRDRFVAIRTDGDFLAAAASQSSHSQPHTTSLYVVDCASGELRFVVPSITDHNFNLGDGYLACVGYSKSGRHPIEIRRISDGSVVFAGDTGAFAVDFVCCVTLAAGIVRLHNPRSGDVFLDAGSGHRVSAQTAASRVSALVSRGLLKADDPWRQAEAEVMYPTEAHCGEFVVKVFLPDQTQLVALRRQD